MVSLTLEVQEVQSYGVSRRSRMGSDLGITLEADFLRCGGWAVG